MLEIQRTWVNKSKKPKNSVEADIDNLTILDKEELEVSIIIIKKG